MSDIAKQVIAGLILVAIPVVVGYIVRHLLKRVWDMMIRFAKRSSDVLLLLYIVLVPLLELVAYVASGNGIGIAISIVQIPLFWLLGALLREKYSPPALRIISAKYGAHGQTIDVTKRLQSLIENGKIDIQVSNNSMGKD